MSWAHVQEITVDMQELKTSNSTGGGQYLNQFSTNLSHIQNFLIDIWPTEICFACQNWIIMKMATTKFLGNEIWKVEYLNIR